jgi:hypothetical protein
MAPVADLGAGQKGHPAGLGWQRRLLKTADDEEDVGPLTHKSCEGRINPPALDL